MRDIIGISFVNARDVAKRLLRYGALRLRNRYSWFQSRSKRSGTRGRLLSAAAWGLYTVALSFFVSRVPNLIFNAMSDVIRFKSNRHAAGRDDRARRSGRAPHRPCGAPLES